MTKRPTRTRPTPRAETRFRIRPGIAHREIEGQLLLLTPSGTDIYTLNESGKLVWQGLLRGQSADSLARRLAEKYRLPPDQARDDVLALLADLRRKRVIQPA